MDTTIRQRQLDTLRARCEADRAARGTIDADADFELNPIVLPPIVIERLDAVGRSRPILSHGWADFVATPLPSDSVIDVGVNHLLYQAAHLSRKGA